MIERQELWCHECQRYVQFDIDMEQNGNHVIKCPNCGHEHCRVVQNGIIIETRWDRRNSNSGSNNSPYTPMPIFMTTGVTASATSTFATYTANNIPTANSATSAFTYMAWMNTGAGTYG